MLTVSLTNIKTCGVASFAEAPGGPGTPRADHLANQGAKPQASVGTGTRARARMGENRMFPAIRVIFAAVGAIVGANMGPGGRWFFDALVGAFIGFAIAEFTTVRGRILSLEQ